MDIHGIISQSGFEFQKQVFILNLLQLVNASFIVYEGMDDIEISEDYFPISSIVSTNNNRLIQVKSGDVTLQILEKIFMNWLLNFDIAKEYVCYIENVLEDDYKTETFINNILDKVSKSSRKRSDSILKRLYIVYSTDKNSFVNNLKHLINSAKFVVTDKDKLLKDIFNVFVVNYSNDGSSDFTQKERFEEFNRVINEKLSKALYFKAKFKFTFSDLFNVLSDINSKISKDSYEVNYTEFKDRKRELLNSILSRNTRAVRQLRLVDSQEVFIIEGLTQQLFYEDLRDYYINMGKDIEISNIELNANINFNDVKGELISNEDVITPAKLFYRTIKRDIRSPLFRNDSGQYLFYKKGCYIHLTDDGVEDSVSISWSVDDEE